MAGRKTSPPMDALRKAEFEERQRQIAYQEEKRQKERQAESVEFMRKHGLKTSADVAAFLKKKFRSFTIGGGRDRASIIANWVRMLVDPKSSMLQRDSAKQALANLHATEVELEAARGRTPGADDEEKSGYVSTEASR